MDAFISIIICTRNRADSLRHTMESIGRAAVPSGWKAELLVVDNGSTDHTSAVVGAAKLFNVVLRYLHEPKPGLCYARNTGIREAAGTLIVFTDDDIRVPAKWIEGMCQPILDGTADAVQGGIKPAPHLERPWLTDMLRVWLAVVEDPERPPEGSLVGANMAFARRMVEIAGGFDPRLGPGAAGFYDDTMFGWALKRAGKKILYRPAVAVEHHFDPDRLRLASFVRIAKNMAASRAIVDKILDPSLPPPSILDLLLRLPRFAFRCATQAFRFLAYRAPDPGFLSHYYRLCLWTTAHKLDRTSRTPDGPARALAKADS